MERPAGMGPDPSPAQRKVPPPRLHVQPALKRLVVLHCSGEVTTRTTLATRHRRVIVREECVEGGAAEGHVHVVQLDLGACLALPEAAVREHEVGAIG
eukprot:CAMPEP_0119371208 /NCGR_PEP_ID=MMETSP1334-20130426/17437_1 /TAXON_ID=127549 /ORGANISM="Calcidiscus leptoporus, Strain RCC1130" /LENGTH=97 /DNA_ID=CAMNT_0007388439 /DNA_START=1 /DNA_END=294 /DNA_ORIENTATION=+